MMRQPILEHGDKDAWICICGNMPSENGFYPCDQNGVKVEPIEGEWDGELYVCDQCKLIISQAKLEKYGLLELVGYARSV